MGMGAAALLLQQQLGHHQHRLVSQLWPCEMRPWSYSLRVLSSSQAKEDWRSEAPSAGASEEEINARSKHPRAKAALSSFPLD
jgi:hypothetical protein